MILAPGFYVGGWRSSDKMRFLWWDSCAMSKETWTFRSFLPISSTGWWSQALRQFVVQLCPQCLVETRISHTFTYGGMLLETWGWSYCVRDSCTPTASFRCWSKCLRLLKWCCGTTWDVRIHSGQEEGCIEKWWWDNLYLRSNVLWGFVLLWNHGTEKNSTSNWYKGKDEFFSPQTSPPQKNGGGMALIF